VQCEIYQLTMIELKNKNNEYLNEIKKLNELLDSNGIKNSNNDYLNEIEKLKELLETKEKENTNLISIKEE